MFLGKNVLPLQSWLSSYAYACGHSVLTHCKLGKVLSLKRSRHRDRECVCARICACVFLVVIWRKLTNIFDGKIRKFVALFATRDCVVDAWIVRLYQAHTTIPEYVLSGVRIHSSSHRSRLATSPNRRSGSRTPKVLEAIGRQRFRQRQ